jgi:hypothetical protein
MATETYIVTSISAGNIVDKDTGKPVVWANIEVINVRAKSQGRDGNVSYGSPRVKLNLVDESTGLPNIQLAKKLEHAGVYGKAVTFEGIFDVVKQKGEEKLSFVIFDAQLQVAPVSKAS